MLGVRPKEINDVMKLAAVYAIANLISENELKANYVIPKTLDHSGNELSNWLTRFDDVREVIIKSVNMIRNHPLVPNYLPFHTWL